MRRAAIAVLLLASCLPATGVAAPKKSAVVDPAFGETLYAFYQRQYFDALSRLLVARERKELKKQVVEGELLLGGLYVQYDIPDAAREIFSTLLPEAGDSPQGRRIWQAIAELDYRRGRFPEALALIEKYFPRPPAGAPAAAWPPETASMLAAKSLMRMGRYREAIEWLGPLAATAAESRYLAFNLAVAQVGDGEAEEGEATLRQLLAAPALDDEMRAFRDRVALALAALCLRGNRAADALAAISEARLDGPYSNEALLVYGTASLRASNQKWAISALSELVQRSPHDLPVQEGWVALAQAYDQARDARRAKVAYRAALHKLDGELAWLQEQEKHVSSGQWFAALENRAQAIALRDDKQGLAESDMLAMPLHYRMFASNAFVLTFAQYVEVSRLSRVAQEWQARIPVLDHLVEGRIERHQRLAREARSLLAELPVSARERQQQSLADRVQGLLGSGRALAVPEKQRLLQLAAGADEKMRGWPDRDWGVRRDQLALLQGVLDWELARERPLREWDFRRELRAGGRQVDEMKVLHARVEKAAGRQRVNVEGWRRQLAQEDARLRELATRSLGLRQGLRAQLEQGARETITARRERLIELAADAWFGLAQVEHASWRNRQRVGTDAGRAAEESGEALPAADTAPASVP